MSDGQERGPDNLIPDTGQLWLSAIDAARWLGVHERTVRRAIARGAIPATKRSGTWRIERDALDRLRLSARGARGARRPRRPAAPPALTLLPPVSLRPPFVTPQPRTPLIGRERDIAAVIARLMDERAALVTLTGPGGSGKTRLALAVAAALRDRFADGIWFVDLSALRDPGLVPDAIVQALELREIAGQRARDRLRAYLGSRTTLLVLDNVEQVVEAAPAIGGLLTACPGLQVLATSRVPLHLSMEHQMRVMPLDLPAAVSDPDRVDVAEAAATRLFAQAARRVRADFAVTEANAAAIAELCRRLDGLPLAIELAAAQSGTHAPGSLLARLDDRLGLLDHGPRDAPPRLRSMRDAIGWSDALLAAPLRQRFRRLGVFDGGFTVEAAAAVTSHPPLDAGSIAPHLRALVDASLVVVDPETTRYTLLETIREFALEQLERAGELDTLREAHARWCRDLLEGALPHWFTPAQTRWGDRIEGEHANLRSALAWLDAAGRDDDLIALAGLMWPFWFVRSHWVEGMTWLRRALDASAGQRTGARLRLLIGAGCLWIQRGDEPTARAFNEEARALCHELGHVGPFDNPLVGLAVCANMRGDFEEGHRLNLEALAMLRAHADAVPLAVPMASVILGNMAGVLIGRGLLDEAEPLLREALAMQLELGFDWAAAESQVMLGEIAEARGQHERATTRYREGLRLAVRAQDHKAIVDLLDRAARFLAGSGDHERVALLLGASARLHELVGDVQGEARRAELARLEARARRHLGDDACDRLVRHGRATSLAEVIAVALDASVPPPARVPVAAARLGITRRELDVLALMAQGLTDGEIAAALYIGRRTVHTHVSRLLGKLGVANRREAVGRARAGGLLDEPPSPEADT